MCKPGLVVGIARHASYISVPHRRPSRLDPETAILVPLNVRFAVF